MPSDQPPLFDVDLIPLPGDSQSVGELLQDVDRQARALMFDVGSDDAAPLLRAWPRFVEAGWELWQAIPGRPTDGHARTVADQSIERARVRGDSMRGAIESQVWPRSGPRDERLEEWTGSLRRAAVLVARYAAEVPAERADARHDIETARTRLIHALYVTNHAVVVALRERHRELAQPSPVRAGSAVAVTKMDSNLASNALKWTRHLVAVERNFADFLSPHLGQRLTAHAITTEGDPPHRWGRAVAAWDIQSHRTLARHPAAANVHLACRVQALIGETVGTVIAGRPSSPREQHEIRADIDAATRAWTSLARRWHDLVNPFDPVDPLLARAASEVRTATSEVQTWATGDESEAGSDPALLRAGAEVLASGADLASLVQELSWAPHLRGPARALSRRAHSDAAADIEAGRRPDVDTIWVGLQPILRGHLVDLPEPVATCLRASTDNLVSAARLAATCSSVTWIIDRSSPSSTAEDASELAPSASLDTEKTGLLGPPSSTQHDSGVSR